jgi:hypothetical protein
MTSTARSVYCGRACRHPRRQTGRMQQITRTQRPRIVYGYRRGLIGVTVAVNDARPVA